MVMYTGWIVTFPSSFQQHRVVLAALMAIVRVVILGSSARALLLL
jgi:hypothetical protein